MDIPYRLGEATNPVEPARDGVYPRVLSCPPGQGEIWHGNVDHPSNTRFHYYLAWTGQLLTVGIQYIGAYHFNAPIVWHYTYEKFRLRSERDAKCVADFLNDQLYPGQARQFVEWSLFGGADS